MRKILLLKHWQIFLIFFLFPVLPRLLFFAKVVSVSNPKILFALSSAAGGMIYLFWVYAIGIILYSLKRQQVNLRSVRFQVSIVFMLLYFPCFVVLFSIYRPEEIFESSWAGLLFILHLSAIICMIYCAYFIAKLINTIEQNKNVRDSQIIVDIFLIMFFPVGIWIIQPRLNNILKLKTSL